MPPADGLQVIDVLGVFYRDNSKLMVADEFEGVRDVEHLLSSFEGQFVRLIAHHRPPNPPQRERWGAGSCMLENIGYCSFGHHDDPSRAFAFNCSGDLRQTPEGWVLQNQNELIPIVLDPMIAHRSQIIILKPFDMDRVDEEIRRLDPSTLESGSVEELSTRLRDIREFITTIQGLKDKINV